MHEEVTIIYVVDGYEASLTTDDCQKELARACGDTIAEALLALEVEVSLGRVRA